jgi:uncharacterized phage protein (predicted DNA packaging)
MTAVTVEDIKLHLNLPTDDDDALLSSKIEAAEAWISDYLGWGSAPLPDAVPAPVKEAARKLVAEMYENREVNTPGSFGEISPTITELLGPYRTSWFGE